MYELAMYLDLLNKAMFPKWPEVFAAAETVMGRLEKADRELHAHLKRICLRDVTVNSKVMGVNFTREVKILIIL